MDHVVEQEVVRWTLSAFTSNQTAEDDEILRIAVARGLPVGLAERAIAMLPLAFGRALLADTGAAFSDEYMHLDAKGRLVQTRALRTDPIFEAALSVARDEANRDQMKAIALRSAEVKALNNALNAGSRIENLMFSPSAVVLRHSGRIDRGGDDGRRQRLLRNPNARREFLRRTFSKIYFGLMACPLPATDRAAWSTAA